MTPNTGVAPIPDQVGEAAPETTVRSGTYEMMVIIPATLSDEEAAVAKTKIAGLLSSNSAKVTAEEDMGKRKLAYPINHIRQGFYHLYQFEAPSRSLKGLDAALWLAPEVLRHMITVRIVKTQAQIDAENMLRERIMAKRAAAEERAVADRHVKAMEEKAVQEAQAAPKTPAREVTKEEFEKKLEEILTDETLGE